MEVSSDNSRSATLHASEQLLVERAKSDEAAFTELYNLYIDKIYGYIYKRTRSKETAEDITSTVFMKTFTHLGKYNYRECSFSAWLYTIATNCLIDHYRQSGRRPEVMPEEMPEIHDPNQNPHLDTMRGEDRQRVLAVLTMLPERYQKVLHLKYFAELANHEIADALGMSANAVGVLLHRATASFEEKYTSYV